MRLGKQLAWVWSHRSPSGCGDAFWQTVLESNHHEEAASLADPNQCTRSRKFTYFQFSIKILIRLRQCNSDLVCGSLKGLTIHSSWSHINNRGALIKKKD